MNWENDNTFAEFSDDINGDDLLTYAYTYDIANDCILSMYNFFGTLYEKEFSDTVFIDSSASSSSSDIRSPSECQIFVTSKELLSQAIKMNSENHPEMAAKLLKQLVNMFQSFSDISSTSITRLKDHKRFTEVCNYTSFLNNLYCSHMYYIRSYLPLFGSTWNKCMPNLNTYLYLCL